MKKEVKQVAWGYVVGIDGVRAGAQSLEELNQMMNAEQAKTPQRPKDKTTMRGRQRKLNLK